MRAWIEKLFHRAALIEMGHEQRRQDANLGLGWLYYALARIFRPRTAVVIGSWRGFAPLVFAKGLADNHEGGEVIFIDPSFVDGFWRVPAKVADYFASLGITNVRHFLATTQQFVRTPAYRALSGVGLVFIDGHHSYQQARFDFDAFEKKLAIGGVMLFHDSTAVDMSTMYGVDRVYARQVKFLMDELRQRPDLQVFDVTRGPGVTLVSRTLPRGHGLPRGPDHLVDRWLRSGTDSLNARHAAGAVDCFDRVLKLNPDDRNTWALKGAALFLSGSVAQALACFEEAERLGHPRTKRAIGACKAHLARRAAAARGRKKRPTGYSRADAETQRQKEKRPPARLLTGTRRSKSANHSVTKWSRVGKSAAIASIIKKRPSEVTS